MKIKQHLVTAFFLMLCLGISEAQTIVSIEGDQFYINGKPTYEGRYWKGNKIEGLLMNSRMVQGLFDDLNPETARLFAYPDTKAWDAKRNNDEFVDAMEEWHSYGMNSFTLNMQGGSPTGYGNSSWLNPAFHKDGSLMDAYMLRLDKILHKADELEMVVILGFFYFGQDQHLENDEAIKNATGNMMDWLFEKDYRNVLIEICNETHFNGAYDRDILLPDRIHELIELAQKKEKNGYRYLVGTSFGGLKIPTSNVVKASDFLLIHGNGGKEPAMIQQLIDETRKVEGYRTMPVVINEDDHYDFDKEVNNFSVSLENYVSWGYFDFRFPGETDFVEGYQSVPVDWGINSERKKAFFNKVAEITGTLPVTDKTRLIILADMGNEPDEEQQMMHMLMCSNEFELEGLIAVTGKFLQPANVDPYRQVLHPELLHKLINGYEEVYENLVKHAPDYPEPDFLRSIVVSGQKGYGIKDAGAGKSSEGSRLIEHALDKPDARPLYVVVNAGSNTLAQALIDYRSKHSAKELKAAVEKLRVYENGAQDNSGAWICHEFPDIHWFRSNFQAYCYGGPGFEAANDGKGDQMNMGPHTWQPYTYSELGQHQWALEHIMMQHGPFGILWPMRSFEKGQLAFIEGGGTVPWLCLVSRGLSDINKPWWGGWSGRSTRNKVENYGSKHATVRQDELAFEPFYLYGEEADSWMNPADGRIYEGIFVPVWRWRQAFFNDFKCRMDWCNSPYEAANHHPVAVLNKDASDDILIREVKAGSKFNLSSQGSYDPDGDEMEVCWWFYREAGTYEGETLILSPDSMETTVEIPKDAGGTEIHVILQVKDKNRIASLYDYRRMVLFVE